jgi:hypothetical protein
VPWHLTPEENFLAMVEIPLAVKNERTQLTNHTSTSTTRDRTDIAVGQQDHKANRLLYATFVKEG